MYGQRFPCNAVFCLLAAALTPLTADALSAARSGAGSASAEWRACAEAEAEVRATWAAEFHNLEGQLALLTSLAAPAVPPPSAKAKLHANPLDGVKLNFQPTKTSDLAPALGMLKGLYQSGREKIAQLNVREQESKKKFSDIQAAHDKKLAVVAARLKNGTLSKDMAAMKEKDEAHLFTYWQKVRELQHRQFHTALKIQHATLSKVKGMMDLYERTIAGKEDKQKLAKEFREKEGLVPDVVLLQQEREGLQTFCAQQLAAVQQAEGDLKV